MAPADIRPEQLASLMALLRGWDNCNGAVITIPHERPIVEYLDEVTERAQRLGAVNVVRRHGGGTLSGDMADGLGFIAAAAAHGFTAEGRAAAVIGAGGAGSAIADALCEEGIGELAVTDLDADRAEWLRRSLTTTFPNVAIRPLESSSLGRFDLVVNASPVGMDSPGAMPVDAAAVAILRPDCLTADVVTRPPATAFLTAVRSRGCRIQTGPEMAAGQMEALGRFMRILP